MFGIKTFIKKTFLTFDIIFSNSKLKKIPRKPSSRIYLHFILSLVLSELKQRKKWPSLNNLFCYPHPLAVKTWSSLLPFNPNNLGNWSIQGKKPTRPTAYFEKDVIEMTIDLLRGNKKNFEGYITSGGTEGNIYSAWLGRKYLETKMQEGYICLVRNDLTHYSIRKATDIIGVKDVITPVNELCWNTDIPSLEKTILNEHAKGARGFLIPITLGYTVGGTNDDIKQTLLKVQKLKKQLKGSHFFLWVDAALSGLVLPFTEKKFKPLTHNLVQTILIDYHKFGTAPYPSGIVLYSKHLRNLIEQPIPYLTEKDNTLLGSRTGIPAVVVWTILHALGKTGFTKMIKDCIIKKENFLEEIKVQFPETRIINYPNSVQAALIVQQPLPEKFERKYGLHLLNYSILFEDGRKILKVYKLFFLPKF